MREIMEYVRQNRSADPVDIVAHFEDVMEIPKMVELLKTEADHTAQLKGSLRPEYGKRLEVEERIRMIMSGIEGEIFLEYPPRKGSEAQRETLRLKLQSENPEYLEHKKEFDAFTSRIQDIEDELKILDMKCKNARRITELFGNYMEFIVQLMKKN